MPPGDLGFVAQALPPPLVFDMSMALALSRADAALSELSGLGGQLAKPHMLTSPYMRREAVLSCRIAGSKVSLSELLIDEIEYGAAGSGGDDIREVRNHTLALEHGIDRLRELPLSLRLIGEVHAKLMAGVGGTAGVAATPGEFRDAPHRSGPAGGAPPPVTDITPSLREWESFVQLRDALPDLIQCALMHWQFATIRPFHDGNGRIGRLLVTLFLIDKQRLSQPLLDLSAFIDAHRSDYHALMQRVRTHGDWYAWLRFFLQGVTETARAAAAQAGALQRLRGRYRTRLGDKPNALGLLDDLFTNPYMTISRAAKLLRQSHPTARAAVVQLEENRVLREITGRQWGRFYVCQEVLDALEQPID